MQLGIIPNSLPTGLTNKLSNYTTLPISEQLSLKKEALSALYEPPIVKKAFYAVIALGLAQRYYAYNPSLQADIGSTIFGAEFGLYSVATLAKLIGLDYHPSLLEESVIAGLGGYSTYEIAKSLKLFTEGTEKYQKLVTAYNLYTVMSVLVPFFQKMIASKNFDPSLFKAE